MLPTRVTSFFFINGDGPLSRAIGIAQTRPHVLDRAAVMLSLCQLRPMPMK